MSVEAETQGFMGHANGHVAEDEFKRSKEAIRNLQRVQQGDARFSSVIPGEFEVSVRSIDIVGHFAVQGKLRSDNNTYEKHINVETFSLELDPSYLVAFVKSFDE